jgi:hypothetical protein
MRPAPAAPRSFRAAGPTEALRIAALGVNAWAVALLLPVLHGGVRDSIDATIVPLPLLPLAFGVVAIAANGSSLHRASAVGALLFAFPVALAGALAWRADLATQEAWGAIGLFVAALSTLAYGAVAAEACSRPLTLRTSSAQSLPSPLALREPLARAWLRRLSIGGTTLGALAAAVVAPALGARTALVRAWGESADEAAVLASLVGGTAAAIGIAAILGPSFRAPRAAEQPGGRRTAVRIAVAAALGIAAFAGYVVLRHFDAR